jgi:hypothetical protein
MPAITITAINPLIQYPATLGQTLFTFAFAVIDAASVQVYVTRIGQLANEDTQQLLYNIEYTVLINPPPAIGGSITINLTPPLQAEDRVTILRSSILQRVSNYTDGSLMSAASLNNDFNTNVMVEQELGVVNTQLGPRYNVCDMLDGSDTLLPRLPNGCTWVKKADGTGIVAQNISNLPEGAIAAVNPMVNGIAVFQDNQGTITSTAITIDANNNIANANNITGISLNVGSANIQTNIATNNMTSTGTINANNITTTGNLIVANNGFATVDNLTVNGSFVAPNFTQNTINATNSISAPVINATQQLVTPRIFSGASLPLGGIAPIIFDSPIVTRSISTGTNPISTMTILCGGINIGDIPNYPNYRGIYTSGGNAALNITTPGVPVSIWNSTGNTATPLRLYDSTPNNYVDIQAPAAIAASYSITLPTAAAPTTIETVLTNDGTGQLNWVAPTGIGGGIKAFVIFKLTSVGGIPVIVNSLNVNYVIRRNQVGQDQGIFYINLPGIVTFNFVNAQATMGNTIIGTIIIGQPTLHNVVIGIYRVNYMQDANVWIDPFVEQPIYVGMW